MFKAIIRDNLLDNFRTARPCKTEAEAITEGEKKIDRLCNTYNVAITDGRFYIDCIEIDK